MWSVILCKIGWHRPGRQPLRERNGILTGHCRHCARPIYRDDRHDRWALENASA